MAARSSDVHSGGRAGSMQRVRVPAKSIGGGEGQSSSRGASGPCKMLGSSTVNVMSKSGAVDDPRRPEAARFAVPVEKSMHVPAADRPPPPPGAQGFATDAGPVPAMQHPSASRSSQSAEVASVLKSKI